MGKTLRQQDVKRMSAEVKGKLIQRVLEMVFATKSLDIADHVKAMLWPCASEAGR